MELSFLSTMRKDWTLLCTLNSEGWMKQFKKRSLSSRHSRRTITLMTSRNSNKIMKRNPRSTLSMTQLLIKRRRISMKWTQIMLEKSDSKENRRLNSYSSNNNRISWISEDHLQLAQCFLMFELFILLVVGYKLWKRKEEKGEGKIVLTFQFCWKFRKWGDEMYPSNKLFLS